MKMSELCKWDAKEIIASSIFSSLICLIMTVMFTVKGLIWGVVGFLGIFCFVIVASIVEYRDNKRMQKIHEEAEIQHALWQKKVWGN